MSVPRKHHYVPEFFLHRWAVDGRIWRFDRPRGQGFALFAKHVPPSAAACLKDLYADRTEEDLVTRQSIESELFQKIDDRGARALTAMDQTDAIPPNLRYSLAQFVISLIHRSPSRIDWVFDEMKKKMEDELPEDGDHQDYLRSGALAVLTRLVSSRLIIEAVGAFRPFLISLKRSDFDFLLSDSPVMLSNGIREPDGYVMLPVGPRQLMILTARERVAMAFGSQNESTLVRAVNDAVVKQARHVVIGTTRSHQKFIDNRFLTKDQQPDPAINPLDGLMRWAVP